MGNGRDTVDSSTVSNDKSGSSIVTSIGTMSEPLQSSMKKKKKKKRKKSKNINNTTTSISHSMEPSSNESSGISDSMIQSKQIDPSEGASKRRRLNDDMMNESLEKKDTSIFEKRSLLEEDMEKKETSISGKRSLVGEDVPESKRRAIEAEEDVPADAINSPETNITIDDNGKTVIGTDGNRGTTTSFRPLFKRSPLYKMQRVAIIE